jgi:two-component system cell cycle sensor histidine kinase/response regulator CckA
VGVNIDISERRRARQALAEQARLLDLSSDAITVRDTKDHIIYWNHGAEELYGWRREEALGKVADELLQGEFPEPLDQILDKLHRDNRWSGDVVHSRRDGKRINVSMRWVLDRDSARRPASILVTSSDITDRKRAEAALNRFNEDLEKIVTERTTDLMQANVELRQSLEQREKLEEQFRQSQKMEAIGTLSGGIAHDFNNILGIILGYPQELYGRDPRDHSRSTEVIISAAERGAKVVKQLLTFARKSNAEQKPVDINALVRDTLDILKELFLKTIIFSIKLDPTLPIVEGDQNQLQQALINICLNAQDAMPEGGTLSIRTSWVSAGDIRECFPELNGDCVQIDVSDTGTGMDDETRQRAFEPFFTTKSAAGGTGLGLSVVYGIVQAHRGFIDIESERNRGTLFKLYFPIPSQAAKALGTQPSDGKAALSNGETLLIVEDEPQLLELVRISAEKRDFRVLTARDGEEALQLYHDHWRDIDVVLLDWGLPRLGGSAVFRKLKELNPQVKVIGLSGYLNSDLKNSLLTEGVQDFIEKPCAPNEILEKVLASCQTAQTALTPGAA